MEGWLPLLCPPWWSERATALHRALLPGTPGSPLVAWVRRGTHATEAELVRTGSRMDDFEKRALANLRRTPAAWRVADSEGGIAGLFATPTRLVCEAEWAAERVLDSTFLGEAASRLGSERLAVAAPRRGVLLATKNAPGPFERLVDIAIELHRAHATESISPLVIEIRDSRVAGCLTPPPPEIEEEEDDHPTLRGLDARLDPEPVDVPGGRDLRVRAYGTSAEAVSRAVAAGFARTLMRALTMPGFSGHIEWVVHLEDTPENRGVVGQLDALITQRAAAVKERALRVSVRLGP